MKKTAPYWLQLGLTLCLFSAQNARSQPIEGLVNVRFQADVRVFAVMAAANVAGLDLDAGSLDGNQVRRLVRQRLADVDPDLRKRLRAFYERFNSGQDESVLQGRFVSYALWLQGPPNFELSVPLSVVPDEIVDGVGLEKLVSELWTKGGLASLWNEVRPQYVAQVEAYRPLLRNLITETLRYLHTEPRVALDREVVFIPDLLNGYGIVNARNIGNDYIVVVGPSRNGEPPTRGVRHEYLHFLVDPLVEKHRERMPDPAPFLSRSRTQVRAVPAYGVNFPLMLTESLIKVLESRLQGDAGSESSARLVELYDQGLILAPYFQEQLAKFEMRKESLQEIFPEWMAGIHWETEEKREIVIANLRQQLEEQQAMERQAGEKSVREKAEVNDLLARADSLLQKHEFSPAKEILQAVLARDRLNPNGWFGLAQVASHEQDLEAALSYYQLAADNAGETVWITAWALVRRGNIFAFQGDLQRARSEWERVIHMGGDLRGADDAAKKSLAEPR